MCGIAGLLRLDGSPLGEADQARVRAMNAAQAHRGPDGEGLYREGPLALGHRRLAILDLQERSAQPFRLAEAGLALVFNGEIYNYLELRAELEQAGVEFRTSGDTEVVLQAYRRWGVECFARFNGMWALAIWDAPQGQLVLSRDRFGIKPLYLARHQGELLFASEIKALLAAGVPRRPDEGVLGAFLAHGVQDDGARTFFAAVTQLSPGHYSVLSCRGHSSTNAYWSLDVRRWRDELRTELAQGPRALRRALERAVALRLRSDVPVGTCLSGGLDSSSIVACVRQALGADGPAPRCFTAGYQDPGCDERQWARRVAQSLGALAFETTPAPGQDLLPLLDRIGWAHDEPCSRPGLVTQWHVMALARHQVTVLLDGQGSDELLLGYAYYGVPYLSSLLQRAAGRPWDRALWTKLLRDAGGLLALPSTSSLGSGSLLRLLSRAALAQLGPASTIAPELGRAAETLEAERAADWLPDDAAGTTPIEELLARDLTRRSIPALLHHEDRTSMAFSLEARVPFLDYHLVELALAIAPWDKVDGPETKVPLRRALAGRLPAAVLGRRDKLGYPTPIARWLRDARDDVTAVLSQFATRGLVPTAEVERASAGLLSATSSDDWDPWRVYRWLTVELWWERFLDATPAAPAGMPALRPPRGAPSP